MNDSFVIEIQSSKVQQLVNEFDGDYGLMAEHLKIMNKRMVLLNPVRFLKALNTPMYRNSQTVKQSRQLQIINKNSSRK